MVARGGGKESEDFERILNAKQRRKASLISHEQGLSCIRVVHAFLGARAGEPRETFLLESLQIGKLADVVNFSEKLEEVAGIFTCNSPDRGKPFHKGVLTRELRSNG